MLFALVKTGIQNYQIIVELIVNTENHALYSRLDCLLATDDQLGDAGCESDIIGLAIKKATKTP